MVHDRGLLVRGAAPNVSLPTLEDLASLGLEPSSALYLGRLGAEDCFVVDASDREAAEPWSVVGLRALYGLVEDALFAVAGRATQIAGFAATHRYCGRCGQPTRKDPSERSMRCDACGLAFYPRISPAIIVLVRRGREALLARSVRFATGFYSTLAGFVEPGESLEETLRREVLEEVAIDVQNIRYFGSQPWPFPHSLMVGFVADYAGGEIQPDPSEIADARWFSPDDLPLVPPKLSIARQLIDAWVREVTGAGLEPAP